MSYEKSKVIAYAISQIGYHEKATNASLDDFTANSGSGNWTKYARDLDALKDFYNGNKNGYAWCDVFVDACFVACYGRAGAQFLLCQPDRSLGAGCEFSAKYYDAKHQFHKNCPETGDQIFFGTSWSNITHTGIVIGVNSSYVTTVEGNSSDMVAKRTYVINDSRIFGYGRPAWGEQPKQEEPQQEQKSCSVTLPKLRKGDKSGYVRSMQTLLIAQKYSCGGYGADGEFGPATLAAVNNFQRNRGLAVDGVCGANTWAVLMKF